MPTHDKCMPTHLLTQCIATQRPPAAGPNTGGARDGIGRAHQALLGCVARRSTMRLAYRAAARGDLTLGTDCPRAGQPPLLRWYVPSVFLVSSTSCVCACVRVRVCVCVCVCHVISVLACVESVSSLKRRVSRVWSVWRVASRVSGGSHLDGMPCIPVVGLESAGVVRGVLVSGEATWGTWA